MPRDKSGSRGDGSVRLGIRLLGTVEVILDGNRLDAFNSPRLHRFLALIALRREPQNRSRLAFEMWPDSSERQARTNLRKLLHDIRQALPGIEDFADFGGETLRWLTDGPSQVDALVFRNAIASGDFELAARLYKGDLLPACYDDWVLEQRDSLRGDALDALLRLADGAAQHENIDATIRHTESAISLDPTNETVVQLKMETHRAMGDRAAAIRTYHGYADALQRDFDLRPDGGIEDMYLDIRGGSSSTDNSPGAEPAPTSDAPFVGRDRAWSQSRQAWRKAQSGRAHLLLVTGEPGIGKSRLAMELGRSVRADGHAVASARSYQAAGGLPWGPVIDVLRSPAFENQIEQLDAVWKTELARLLPELANRVQTDTHNHSGAVARRHRLFDAIGRAIISEDRPAMITIDDLQWCDTESIELIGYLVRFATTAPLLVVGTVRWEEIPEGHPLHGLIAALEHDQAVTTIPLERLDKLSTAALADQLRPGDSIDPEGAERLWHETEGNPLFVIETLRAGTPATADPIITPTMRAVLRARLAQLSLDTQRLAEVAAIFGRPFSVRAIAAAMDLEEQTIVEGIDELWRRRIIKDQGFRYDFSHDKLRDVALEMINPARQRQLHRAVAEAIASEHHPNIDPVRAQLAAHYDQAGMVEQAIEAYRKAGSQAVAVSALEEAVELFRRALFLLAELPVSANRDALELKIRIALGSPLVAIEGYGSDSAHQLYERARALCNKQGKPVAPPILRGLGLARLQGCRFDECSEFAQELVDHPSQDGIAKTEGQYLRGVSAFWQGNLPGARDDLEAALESYDFARRSEHLSLYAQDPKAICLVRLALVLLWSGDGDRADEMARAAKRTAAELDHPMTSAYVITYAAILAAEAEDIPRLTELVAEADKLWDRLSERYLVVVLDALRGWLEVRSGSVDGVNRIRQAAARSRKQGENLHLSYTLLLLARARALRGEIHEGRAAIREGLEWGKKCNQHYLMAELLRTAGELAYHAGDIDEARATLREAASTADAQGARWLELRALYALATRFPDQKLHARLGRLVKVIPSGRDLPAFQAAKTWLSEPG